MSTLAPPSSKPIAKPAATSAPADLAAVLARFPAGSILPQEGLDQPTWIVSRDVLFEVARELKENPATQFDMMLDLCGADFPDRAERFEALYHLYSMQRKTRLRLKVPLREDDLVLPSMMSLWKALDWFEREAYDMFGIEFDGHPELTRILMPDDWDGHPLRKDYPSARVPVTFKGDPHPR